MTNREIDRLIAEKVMDWTQKEHWEHGEHLCNYWVDSEGRGAGDVEDWHPSTEISDAWQVVEKIRLEEFSQVRLAFNQQFFGLNITDLSPRKICLASLLAKGVDLE